jgi:GNAT superfamily N-acetyltransferase
VFEIRSPVAEDAQVVERIVGEFLPGSPGFNELTRPPRLALVAVLDDEVIGVCFSYEEPGESIGIEGIAIDQPFAGRGLGTQLLAEFEGIAAMRGARRVSVGSAEGYAEHFYAKNGYTPVEFHARAQQPFSELPGVGLELLRPRKDGSDFLVNLRSENGYTQEEKQRIKGLLQADEVIFIFEKRIAAEHSY